jgi:hypothetical protein
MKNYSLAILAITCLLGVLASCNKSSVDEVEVFDDETTRLFLTSVDEQRCPADAVCVWEGFASVDLRIENESGSATFTLSTIDAALPDDTLRIDTTILNTTITLESILPIPNSGQVLDVEEYTVTVDVEY